MSIWTDLLIRHGHIATPTALALIAPLCPRPVAACLHEPSHAAASARIDASRDGDDCPALPVPHPLRAVGQLR